MRDIPGFFFDKAKNRYFKIQPGSAAAPSAAAYNADNVKKRKVEDRAAEKARKRQEKLKHHIKRSRALRDPLTGGRLVREFGVVDPELPVESWTAGLRDKGEVSFLDPRTEDGYTIPCLLINGDDQGSGMGVVYAPPTPNFVAGCYIPADVGGRIDFTCDPLRRRTRSHELRYEGILLNNLTSISYHAPSQQMLMTCTAPHPDVATDLPLAQVVVFRPPQTKDRPHDHAFLHEPGPHPAWLLGPAGASTSLSLTLPRPNTLIHAARLSPASSSSIMSALLATNRGVMRITDCQDFRVLEYPGHDRAAGDVLAADWHPTNDNIVFAGTRDDAFFRIDQRAGPGSRGECDRFRHRSSVAHLRAVDEHRLLAAGPRGAMAVYDVRWMRGGGRRETAPVVMYGYRNAARVDVGLDVAPIAGGGVVAAGMDDGAVGVFSLRTGRRLRAGGVDGLRVEEGAVVKALQWEAMPWEKDPSLWVGCGSVVRKFSFGLDEGEDEDC